MHDPKSHAAEELHAIRHLLERTKQTVSESWIFFVVWGTGGMTAALISQILVSLRRSDLAWIPQVSYWPICIAISLILANRRVRIAVPLAFVDRIIRTTWCAITVTMLAFIAACSFGALPKTSLGAFLAIESGVGCFITGALVEVRPLYFGAIAWWLGGLIMFAQPQFGFIICAVLFPLAYLFPAFRMKPRPDDETFDGSRI